MNAATEKHLQREVDMFTYLVHVCLDVLPTMDLVLAGPARCPSARCSYGWCSTGGTGAYGSMRPTMLREIESSCLNVC